MTDVQNYARKLAAYLERLEREGFSYQDRRLISGFLDHSSALGASQGRLYKLATGFHVPLCRRPEFSDGMFAVAGMKVAYPDAVMKKTLPPRTRLLRILGFFFAHE